MKDVSNAFGCFIEETPAQAHTWMEAVQKLDGASALDKKTGAIAYVAVLAAVGLVSGLPFHVKEAKALGATRDEIKSAILLSLPAVGNHCIAALPVALSAFDEENKL